MKSTHAGLLELISDTFVQVLISFLRTDWAGHFHPPEGIPGIFRLDVASRETGVDLEHIF